MNLSSCTKEKVSEINITIKNTDQYEYVINVGDEEGASIKTQAKHHQISEIERDSSTGWNCEYTYKPLPNFVGTDFVELKVCTGGKSTGCDNIEIKRINFNVTAN